MKVYHNINDFTPIENSVVTTGTFDGVHNGHKKIISQLTQKAQSINGQSVLITFNPHPRQVLFPENTDLKLLTSIEEKTELIKNCGVNHLIIHPFTLEFSRLKAHDYIKQYLVDQLQIHSLIIGYDHQFGRNREGSFEELKNFATDYGFNIEQITALDIENVNVSSTKIRQALSEGNMAKANKFLGYNFQLSGLVASGDGIGKTLNFPTANLQLNNNFKIIPKNGVYACEVKHNQKAYKGMMNIGTRPTVKENSQLKIEIHLFNFHENIYNQNITVFPLHRLRDEQKFNSLQELQNQLMVDKQNAMRYFEI